VWIVSLVVASRYARALAEVVGKAGNYAEVLQELENFHSLYAENSELREVLETPVVSPADKQKVLNAILPRLGTSEVSSNFLRVLLAHFRMSLLATVILAFRKIANQRLGVVEVEIFHAHEITAEERQALAGRFAGLTGKKVSMRFHRDDTLLGGVLAQIGSVTYDGSLKGSLERLRERLTADWA
jgi:F-type H+-transporting ATPase subunit delta